MLTRFRRVRKPVYGVVAGVLAAALAGIGAAGSPAFARAGHPAGPVEGKLTFGTSLGFEVQGHPFDVATRPDGTAYIGWISYTQADSTRKVHLCLLPLNASSCTGGVQTIDGLDPSGAGDLHVLVDGTDTVHLIWFHDTAGSISGPNAAAIAEATAPHGQNLTAGSDIITNAPSFGDLLDARIDGAGTIWTVAYASGLPSEVKVWHGGTGPETVPTPWSVGYAQLAFTGTKAVMAVEKYGSISTGPSYAVRDSGTWGSFKALQKTWAVGGNAALATTSHGLRIVTAINDASYRPVIGAWNGSSFNTPVRTTDNDSCGSSSHDGVADNSGRLLDAGFECSNVVVTNYADARHSGIVRFAAGGTPTHQPEIASGTRGIATVVWAVETGSTGETLHVVRVRLPASPVSASKAITAGKVTVKGPVSCLPPSNAALGVSHKAAKGWSFAGGSLKLDGAKVGSSLDGATLSPGSSHKLVGTATFAKGGVHKTVSATLSFKACANA